jgi:hypothetical protein
MLYSDRAKRLGYLLLYGLGAILIWLLWTKGFSRPMDDTTPMIRDKNCIIIPEKSPLRNAINVQAVEKALISIPFTRPASIEADPAHVLTVYPPAPGRITHLAKRLGDYVRPLIPQ